MRYFTPCRGPHYALLFLAILLGLVACKEKDVPLGVGDTRITGTWQLYQRTIGPDTNRIVTPISAMPPQTLTFTADGRVAAAGSVTSYYRDVRYYRVDSAATGLEIRLIANVQELPGEPQGLRVRRDTLTLLPYFSPTLTLSFVRVK